MSALRWRTSSGEEALGAGTAETVLQVVAAANHRALITELGVTFKGIVVTDTPVNVKIFRQTGAGTSGAGTMVKDNVNDDEALQTTSRIDFSAEPASDDALIDEFLVHPQTGIKQFFPFKQEIIVVGGGRVGVKVTAAQAQTVVVSIGGEE